MIKTSVYEWSDGKTMSCYAWTSGNDIRWYIINIKEAESLNPTLSTTNAVKVLARTLFTNNVKSHLPRV